jgi:hypothetical protein
MAEWFKAAVLKTVDGETRPGVRIPLPPPHYQIGCGNPLVLPNALPQFANSYDEALDLRALHSFAQSSPEGIRSKK